MTITPRHGALLCAVSAAAILYACASMAQTAGASAQVLQQTLVNAGGGGSGSGTQTIRNTPDANAPSIIPSAPCIAVYSGGVSVAGFGAALGGGQTDQVCQGANLAAIAAGVFQATGSEFAAEVADISLGRALDIYLEDSEPRSAPAVEVARDDR